MAGLRSSDGSFGFSAGVDSSRVSTVQSQITPDGLPRNMLAWLGNGTVRTGGISPRHGWKKWINSVTEAADGLFQGGWVYNPRTDVNPYLIASIGGHIYKILLESPYTVTDLSAAFGFYNPPNEPQSFFCQGEEFLVIQAGDNETLPLFWDGTILRRSYGLFAGTNFSVTLTADWIVPVPGNSITLTLTAPYAGGINDRITIDVDSFGSAGVFLVTGISGNDITIQTLYTAYPNAFFTTFLNPYNFIVSGTKAEIPAATAMCYYMNRLWYAQGRQYCAGDIVGGPSGTAAYKFRDSILKMTESQFAAGGDGFTVPSNAGNIRALGYTASIDNAFGQGNLFVFTRKTVYRTTVPVTRTDWIGADTNNAPLQVDQRTNGTYSDRSLVSSNGDLFYKAIDGIRSLSLSVRNFGQWGNTPISNNENRVFQFEDRSLLKFTSGIEFQNRMLMTCLPKEVAVGTAFQGLIPLDFDLISTLQEKRPPAWEGHQEGLLFLQLFNADFGGLERAFALTYSEISGSIQLWELSANDRFDDVNYDDPNSTSETENRRIEWYFETPAFTWGKEFELKELSGLELWIDKMYGTIEMTIEYRPDADVCWYPWERLQFCTAKSSCENVNEPSCYPAEVTNYREGFKFPITIGKPPEPNKCNSMGSRPSTICYQAQVRVTIKGWCRVRGLILFSDPRMKSPYAGLNC